MLYYVSFLKYLLIFSKNIYRIFHDVDPAADIAHGYEAWEIKLKNGKTVQGFLVGDDKYVLMKTIAGTVAIKSSDVASRKKMSGSVMIPGQHMGLSAQDIRDITELLKRYRYDSRKKKESF